MCRNSLTRRSICKILNPSLPVPVLSVDGNYQLSAKDSRSRTKRAYSFPRTPCSSPGAWRDWCESRPDGEKRPPTPCDQVLLPMPWRRVCWPSWPVRSFSICCRTRRSVTSAQRVSSSDLSLSQLQVWNPNKKMCNIRGSHGRRT